MLSLTMRRLTGVALAAGLAFTIAPSPSDAQTYKWEMASPYPGFNFHGRNHQMFIDEVKEASNGDIDITLHAGASLFKLPEIRRAVQTQQIAIGEQLMSTLENQDPVFGIDAVPFLANGQELSRVLWYAAEPTITKKLDEMGLVLLYAVSWPGQGFFAKQEVTSLETLKNSKMRIQNPSTAKLADMLGAVPVRVESADIPQAMTTGIIESFITSASTGADKKAWDYITHYYDINAYQPKNAVYMNKEIFEELPEGHQKIIMDAAEKAEVRGWFMMTEEIEVKKALLCENVTCFNPPPAALMAEFEEIGMKMTEEWLKDAGPEAKAIVDEYLEMKAAGAVEVK